MGRPRDDDGGRRVLAIHWGFLEIFFASVLGGLVLVVGAFALFVALQLFRNPGRPQR